MSSSNSQYVRPIRHCPEPGNAIETEQNWYHLPAAQALGICSRCYHDHLSQSPFASHFVHDYDETFTSRICDFNTPGMHQALQIAKQRNAFEPLRDHMVARAPFPRCKGLHGVVQPADGFLWHQLRDPVMRGRFGACAACYKDYVAPSSFAWAFDEQGFQQPSNEMWRCDLAFPFAQQLLKGGGDSTEWDRVQSWLLHRAQLPACTKGEAVAGDSRRWYTVRDASPQLHMCESCFYDLIPRDLAEQHFQPISLPNTPKVVCFAGGDARLRVALNEALNRKDWNVFAGAAHAVAHSPPCVKEGVHGGTWYSLFPNCADFDVCAACYACFFVATGVPHLLVHKPTNANEARVCDINLFSPHAHALFRRLDLVIEGQDSSVFTGFAAQIVQTPPCPGGQLVAGRKWYTHELFACCPSCWKSVPISGTSLSSCFSGEVQVDSQLKCDFYSPRVRNSWHNACRNNNLDSFITLMKNRLDVWMQTYPLIQQQLMLMRVQAATQSTLFMASALNTGGSNIAAAAGASGNYGNSQIGYGYETYAGAQGAAQFNQALSMSGNSGGVAGNIAQLEALWATVE